MARFTAERRERFLTLLESGRTIGDACAAVDVSRTTVNKWAQRGRAEDPTEDVREFAERFDALQEGRNDEGLTQTDVVRLLEKAARKGSVQAMKLLLDRPWEKNRGKEPEQPDDPFSALDAEDELTKRRRARTG